MNKTKTYCFISNYLTPHQLPFCLAMQRETENHFVFIETEELPEERRRLGYPLLGEQYDFVINATQSEENQQKALQVAVESDVVIIGSASDAYIKKRLKDNKLTFRFSERIFKKRNFDPLRWLKYTLKNFKYKNKNLFYLLSSAYAPHDYKRCGVKREKMFKWGYFPEVAKDVSQEIIKESNNCVWVGRFLDWKHPEDAVNAVIRLRKEGYDVELDLVGSGEMQDILQTVIKENDAQAYVRFAGNQPYDKVREYMRNAGIFLFTSDYNEGWGAVLNEAMDSGCIVVASHAAGSVPFLIENEKNGFVYTSENQEQLIETLKCILDKKVEAEQVARLARETVATEWNANRATEKLLAFCDAFFAGDYKKGICENGILSYAKAIPQKKMYQQIAKDN